MIFFSKFVQTLNKQLEDGASSRAVVYAGFLRFSKTVFANFHLAPIHGESMIFFSKFVQTLNKQLKDGASSRAVVYSGLLRFSKTVYANFHFTPINGRLYDKFILNLSKPTDYNYGDGDGTLKGCFWLSSTVVFKGILWGPL